MNSRVYTFAVGFICVILDIPSVIMLALGFELNWPTFVFPALFLLWGWGFALLSDFVATGVLPRWRDLPWVLIFLVIGLIFEHAFETIVEGLRLAWATYGNIFVLLLVMLLGGAILLRSFFPTPKRFQFFVGVMLGLAILFSVWSPGRRLGSHLLGYCVGFFLTLLTRQIRVH